MLRLPRPRKEGSGQRRPVTAVPEVPTFKPDTNAVPPPLPAKTADDPSDEAVRRMVEAAYT